MKGLNKQILELRSKLNYLIRIEADFTEIYDLSKAMDELINKYYELKTQ